MQQAVAQILCANTISPITIVQMLSAQLLWNIKMSIFGEVGALQSAPVYAILKESEHLIFMLFPEKVCIETN